MEKINTSNLLLALFLGVSLASYSQKISTIAGDSAGGYSGDGGQATAAEFSNPSGVAVDGAGNIYIADYFNMRVREVNSSGVVSTFAGISTLGFSGDGGPASSAELFKPGEVSMDDAGNIYIADTYNNRIRIVNKAGIINTFAGNGAQSYSGDGGQATLAELYYPGDIESDAFGNEYIVDYGNNRIRKVNASGIISTIAGNGFQGSSGDGGPATAAELNNPAGIAIKPYGNIYISDMHNNRVRKIDTAGIISVFAGQGAQGYSGDGGPATTADLYNPDKLTLDGSGNLYIVDESNYRVREVDTSGIINTFAGIGIANFSGDGGPASSAELNIPTDVKLDGYGNFYIADYENNRIRKISGTSGISEIAFSEKVNIYPSPSTGYFMVSGVSNGDVIEMFNYSGEKVLSAINHQPSANFDISDKANGIYLIRIKNKEGNVVAQKKIIKTE